MIPAGCLGPDLHGTPQGMRWQVPGTTHGFVSQFIIINYLDMHIFTYTNLKIWHMQGIFTEELMKLEHCQSVLGFWHYPKASWAFMPRYCAYLFLPFLFPANLHASPHDFWNILWNFILMELVNIYFCVNCFIQHQVSKSFSKLLSIVAVYSILLCIILHWWVRHVYLQSPGQWTISCFASV